MSQIAPQWTGREPLTHGRLDHIRQQREKSILLFLTDRCPVGCAHCSVDSRADSPTIHDFDLFTEILGWIAGNPSLDVVAISGGEPFVEKRGLLQATETLRAAGKDLVIFTSGVWAKSDKSAEWIHKVLTRCRTVYLSTDGFHADQINDACFIRAAREIVEAGCWLVVQMIDESRVKTHVQYLLEQALGNNYFSLCEINLTKPLANGRGREIFQPEAKHPGQSLGSCHLARNPMIRYDGRVTACCNESVLMGLGPKRLTQKAESAREITEAFSSFRNDPLIRAVGGVGVGALTHHPSYQRHAETDFCDSCDLCWRLMDQTDGPPRSDRLLNAIASIEV